MPLTDTLTAPLLNSSLQTDLHRARYIANWLDNQFNFLGFRFGFESIFGLVPVIGDSMGLLAGLYPIYVARKHHLGKTVEAEMAANLAAEWILGLLPLIGDLADTWFKANLRNLRLLETAATRR